MSRTATAEVEARPGASCTVKFVRMSASKVRLVMDLVRGKDVAEAMDILFHSPRLASQNLSKAIQSAVANANHNDEIPSDELYISACFANEGPTLKRFRPRARGRAGPIHKQTCHITVTVSRYTDDELDTRRERAELKGAASSKKRDASADRRARVSKSKAADEAPVDDVESDVVESEVVESEAAASTAATAVAAAAGPADAAGEDTGVTSTTEDSDSDGEVNAEDASPYGEGSRAALEDDSMPEGFPIKGNDSSKLYHVPDSSFYDRTKAEVWFASEEAAEAAGFQKPASQRDDDATDTADAATDTEKDA